MPKKKKVKLSKETIQGIKDWYKNAPEVIAYNMLGRYLFDKRRPKKFPKITFIDRGPKVISNPFKNVKSWDQINDPIVIECNYSALQQVLGNRPVAKIKNKIREKMMQSCEIIDGCSISCVQTPPEHHDPLVYYESIPDPFGESETPYYLKYQFQNEQMKPLLFGFNDQYANYINQPLILPAKDIHTQQIPYSAPQPQTDEPSTAPNQNINDDKNDQMPLPAPLQTNNGINSPTPLQQGPAQQNNQQNQDKLEPEPVEAKPGTIQEVIGKVGKENFFKDNGKLDEIDIKYNRPRGRGKAIVTNECDDFAEVKYKKNQGVFPIIREMLQRVLTPDKFKKVGYNSKKNKILLPDSAFTGLISELQYLPDLHNSPYKDYIKNVLYQIKNSTTLTTPKNTKELIFLAINRIKADYQAACLAYKQTNSISSELLKYSDFKGHYSSSNNSLGICFKGDIEGSFKPLFVSKKATYPNIKSVSWTAKDGHKHDVALNLRDCPEFKKTNNIITTNDLPEFYKHGLLDPTKWIIKLNTRSLLTKQNEIVTGKIAKGQLDVYKNAATLAALDGKAFPSGDINQDQKYLLHAHIFTVLRENGINLQEKIELTEYQKKQADKHKNDNPFFKPLQKTSQQYYTGRRPIVRTLNPNRQLSTKEMVNSLLYFANFNTPIKTNSDQWKGQPQLQYLLKLLKNPGSTAALDIQAALNYNNIDGQSSKNYDHIAQILEDLADRLKYHNITKQWSPNDDLAAELRNIRTVQPQQIIIGNNTQQVMNNNFQNTNQNKFLPCLTIPKIEKIYDMNDGKVLIKYKDINQLYVKERKSDKQYDPDISIINSQNNPGYVEALLEASSINPPPYFLGNVLKTDNPKGTGIIVSCQSQDLQQQILFKDFGDNKYTPFTEKILSQQVQQQAQQNVLQQSEFVDYFINIASKLINIHNFCASGYRDDNDQSNKNFAQFIEDLKASAVALNKYMQNHTQLTQCKITDKDTLTKFSKIGQQYFNIIQVFNDNRGLFSNPKNNIPDPKNVTMINDIYILQNLNVNSEYILESVLGHFAKATYQIYELFENMQDNTNIMEHTGNDWKFKCHDAISSDVNCRTCKLRQKLKDILDKVTDLIYWGKKPEEGLLSTKNLDTIFCQNPTVAVAENSDNIMLPFGIKMPFKNNNTGFQTDIKLLYKDLGVGNDGICVIKFGYNDVLYKVPVKNGRIAIDYKNKDKGAISCIIDIKNAKNGDLIGYITYYSKKRELIVNSGARTVPINPLIQPIKPKIPNYNLTTHNDNAIDNTYPIPV